MSSDWKIYTKTGDAGTTSLIGGLRVPKFDERIETYGTVDELNSWIGLISDQEIDNGTRSFLIEIQDRLFTLESLFAKGPDANDSQLPALAEADVILLEKEIDKMNEHLPALNSFILPRGHTIVSYCHIARTVCRRAERLAFKMKDSFAVDSINIKYFDHLSDYICELSRRLASDLRVEETLWKPRK